MAGFYIHIPFCRKVCYYCDFHFVANVFKKEIVLEAIKKEIINRKTNWETYTFDTLYFGGGTPSILNTTEINALIHVIQANYNIANDAEITFEANPDDLTYDYLKELRDKTPVNRLSIGTQSFNDKHLQFFNRRHSEKQAISCIKNSINIGFSNITIDLLYGFPSMTISEWKKNIDLFLDLNIPHLSAYHLSIEPKTVFGVWQKKKNFQAINEDLSQQHYRILVEKLKSADFLHYEISNFAKNNKFSSHNKSYWNGTPYIGIGPSAHSYNGKLRRWNIANNTKYSESLQMDKEDYYTFEILTPTEKYNDYILTSLRTMWGVNQNFLENNFDTIYNLHCMKIKNKLIKGGSIENTSEGFRITEKGWLISDFLMSEFFYA